MRAWIKPQMPLKNGDWIQSMNPGTVTSRINVQLPNRYAASPIYSLTTMALSILFLTYSNFLGYFYYRLNLKPFDYDEYNASVIMDGISVELLNRSGLRNDLCVGDYVPETDPEIIAAVEKWRAGEYS